MGQAIGSGEIGEPCARHMRAYADTQYILSGKWRVYIIGTLAHSNKRFMEMQRLIQGIGSKMLSKELQDLEMNGLITRTEIKGRLTSVEYALTESGHSLKAVVDAMAAWGLAHRERVMHVEESTTLQPHA